MNAKYSSLVPAQKAIYDQLIAESEQMTNAEIRNGMWIGIDATIGFYTDGKFDNLPDGEKFDEKLGELALETVEELAEAINSH